MKSSPNALARRTRRPLAVVLAGMGVGVAVLAACALCLGPYTVSLGDTLSILASRFVAIPQTWSSMAQNVILEVRLPRILGALLVGASLAVAGAAYQGIFRNPLVSPDLLGVSSGACIGAAAAILGRLGRLRRAGSRLRRRPWRRGLHRDHTQAAQARQHHHLGAVGHHRRGVLRIHPGPCEVSGRSRNPASRNRVLADGQSCQGGLWGACVHCSRHGGLHGGRAGHALAHQRAFVRRSRGEGPWREPEGGARRGHLLRHAAHSFRP